MIATTSISHDSSLGLSYTDNTINDTLQGLILSVVDAIIEQDSTDRGAWDTVIIKRISLDSCYSEQEIKRELNRMLRSGTLYVNCYEIRNGTFFMSYLRSSSELLGSDNDE